MHALSARRLAAGYHGREVFSGVSFDLDGGELCALIGPNGSGKSTLLRTMLGLVPRTSGSVWIMGRDQSRLGRRETARLVSFLPQEFDPWSRMTVMETVLLGRHPHRPAWASDSAGDEAVAVESMEMAGISDLSGRRFYELSGGERRLVMLAAALAQKPAVLLLDEPAASLDFRHQIAVWDLMDRLAAAGLAIVASTHEVGTACRRAGRILALSPWSPPLFGKPGEVCDPGTLSTVFGLPLSSAGEALRGSAPACGGGGA